MTTDHIAQALARLPEHLKEKPNITTLITAIMREVQLLEDTQADLLTKRSIDTAEGVQLETIGRFVGEPPTGLDDEVYRRRIRARIATNRSHATVEELINICRLVVYDDAARIEVEQQAVAHIVMRIREVATDADVADALIEYLRDAVSAGVRVLLESSSVGEDDTFTLDGTLDSHGFSDADFDTLDLGATTPNVDTVLRAEPPGALGYTLELADDGTGAGTLDDGPDAIFHFQGGVTTVAQFEAAIATSAYLVVMTPGTGATVMQVGDVLSTTSLAGGTNGTISGGHLADVRE